MTNEEFDLGDDLNITKTTRRASGGGTWVSGTLHGHRFDALVFPEHAEVAEYELGDSRISKLWIQRLADKTTTFNWDRGMDQPATDQLTQAMADGHRSSKIDAEDLLETLRSVADELDPPLPTTKRKKR